METSRSIRVNTFADAAASSRSAVTATTAAIICSHSRDLADLEALLAEPAADDATPEWPVLPLRPGHGNVDRLALGAAGVRAIKSAHE